LCNEAKRFVVVTSVFAEEFTFLVDPDENHPETNAMTIPVTNKLINERGIVQLTRK
jgi:hypothetical protein